MNMRRGAVVAAGIVLFGLTWISAGSGFAYAQDPTIPTRTPTPDPNQPPPQPSPTSASDDGGGNPNPPPPAPTETSVPQATATATATTQGIAAPVATATSTAPAAIEGAPIPAPGDAALPADFCGGPPIARAIDLTLVHLGPGEDYPIVGSLPATEERLIVGRAEFAPWWQILLIANEPQLLGWVADIAVDEIGDTGSVPLVVPPPINGLAPTPGAPWNPTPIPSACTPTPTATPTATPSATPTTTATPADTLSTNTDSTTGGEGGGTTGSTTAGLASNDQAAGKQVRDGEQPSADATSETTAAGSSGAASLLVPLLGVGLIAGGVLIALLTRNRPPTA